MEVPACLSDEQIAKLTDANLMRNIISDRERRLLTARGIFCKNRIELSELKELQEFKAKVYSQAETIARLIKFEVDDSDPKQDLQLTAAIRQMCADHAAETSKRARLQSLMDRVRLIWGKSRLHPKPEESDTWKSLLEEIAKEANDEREAAPF